MLQKPKTMKTIKQVANFLIENNISFEYTPTYIKVKGSEVCNFETASLHCETGKLVLMDGKYNEVEKPGFYFSR